jgi:hypothetical protein
MRNISGLAIKVANGCVQEELILARIQIKDNGRDQYLTGRLKEWTFERGYSYWIASTPIGKGLGLKAAIQMHTRMYPITGKDQPRKYGEVIRVQGYSGGIHPKRFAENSRVNTYHIDSQLGLNEFARVIGSAR